MSERADLLHRYIKRGWQIVPIPAYDKAPVIDEWQHYRATSDEVDTTFARGNVGILLGECSNGLVDVDLDCPEAIALAPIFLPPTDMRHGRTSKPNAHRWYIADPLPQTCRLKAPPPNAATLIELRTGMNAQGATGQQTVVPPSVYHNNGHGNEPLVWNSQGTPPTVDGRILEHGVYRLAACALLARSWPSEGSRHDAALAAAGVLLRHGWTTDEAVEFLGAAWRVAGDEEFDDRITAIHDTADSISLGQPTTGIPTLKAHLGEAVVSRICQWLRITPLEEQVPTPPIVDIELEAQHAWRQRLQDNLVKLDELPGLYRRIMEVYQPVAVAFDEEDATVNMWALMMFMPFWSSFFPRLRLQNLNLAIWSAGLAPAGRGKNRATDAYHEFATAVHQNVSAEPLIHFTAGTPEGMWRALDGVGKRMIVYQREFGGWLKQLKRDHMLSAREAMCDLYDGSIVGYQVSKGSVSVIKPHVAACVTTTPEAFIENLTMTDVVNGYISRFMVCAPDFHDSAPDHNVIHPQINSLIADTTIHVRNLQDVERCVYAETGSAKDPETVREFGRYLGLNTGKTITIEEHLLNPTNPAGRPLVRVKKAAALLAIGEDRPETTTVDNTLCLVIDTQHIDLAIQLVQCEIAYTERMMAQVDLSEDYLLTQRIDRILRKYPSGLSKRDLTRKTHRRASEVEIALQLLIRDGIVRRIALGDREMFTLNRI